MASVAAFDDILTVGNGHEITRERSNDSRRTSKGEYATTAQVSLKPKLSADNLQTGEDSLNYKLDDFGSETGTHGRTVTLQPQDVGFGAWSYAASAFAMYIVVWGFPQAFPIFTTHLTVGKLARFPDSVVLVLLAPGVQDVEEGILFQLLPKSSSYRRYLVCAGIFIIAFSLLLASTATEAWQIFAAQGLSFGFGGVLLNFVHISIFPEWFKDRQGQAMGVIWLGFRLGSLAFPITCQWLLDKHGYEKAIKVLIAPMLALLVPSILLLRGRYPVSGVSSASAAPRLSRWQLLREKKLLFYLTIALLFDLVNNVPDMFIMSFGADVGLSTSDQAAALSLLNFSAMLGTYVIGWLSDKGSYEELIALSAISTSMCHFLIWGYAKDKFGIFAYALVVGTTIGGFRNAFFTFFDELSGSNPELYISIHGLFSLVRGLAIVSVGPVGLALIRARPDVDVERYALGKFLFLILYAGGLAMFAGLVVLCRIILIRRSARSYGP